MLRLIAAFLAATAAVAAGDRVRVHAQSEIDIRSIAETPDGWLWLGTGKTGLWRYSGSHYDRVQAFTGVETVVSVAVSGEGTLWVRVQNDGIYRRRGDGFEKVLTGGVSAMEAGPDALYVLRGSEKLRIPPEGAVSPVTGPLPMADGQGRPWRLCHILGACWSEMPPWPHSRHPQAFLDLSGRVWSHDDTFAVAVREGRVVERLPALGEAGPLTLLAPGRRGQIWFLGDPLRGLAPERVLQEAGAQVRTAFEDSRGHVWVSSLGAGLIEHIPEPGWESWTSVRHFEGDQPFQTFRDARGGLVVAGRRRLWRQQAGRWQAFGPRRERYEFVFPLEDGGYLAAVRERGLVRLAPDAREVEQIPDPTGRPMLYRTIARDGAGRIWVGHKEALLELVGTRGSLRLRTESLPGIVSGPQSNTQAVALAADAQGRMWVGYSLGVAVRDGDSWRRIELEPPGHPVRAFDLGRDASVIWLAHRGVPGFSRLRREGFRGRATEFTVAAGYLPPSTNFVRQDRRGWIWRSSDEGVHVADGEHLAPEDWILLSRRNGSPADGADIHGFWEDGDGSIWLAGDGGVTHVRPAADWFARGGQPPRVTGVEVDGRAAGLHARLDSGAKIVRVFASAREPARFREEQWRYRLRPLFDDWRSSRDGVFEFRDLADREYTLEVRLAGQAASYPLRIGPTASYGWVAWVLAAAAGWAALWFSRWGEWLRYRAARWVAGTLPGRGRATGAEPAREGRLLRERFRLVALVSRGGSALVYSGLDARNGDAPVAVKVIPAGALAQPEFTRELAALQSLDCPGVVRILDWWIDENGDRCLAMPFIEGPTLREAMDERLLSPDERALLIEELGVALAQVHRRGLVHRDVKPENVMLDQGKPVLIDFGLAALRGADDGMAVASTVGGSPHYMAPEGLLRRYSPASDIFSLGVLTLELVTGDSLDELAELRARPDLLPALTRALASEELARLIGAALADNPRQRPPDAADWARDVAGRVRAQAR